MRISLLYKNKQAVITQSAYLLIMIKYENKIDKEIKYIYDKAKIRMASNKLDELLDSIEKRIGGR